MLGGFRSLDSLEQRILDIEERASKASIISAIATVVGVLVGAVGVAIGVLSYNNSIYLQRIATKPIVSLEMRYSSDPKKIAVVNDGNGQALIRDILVADEKGNWRSMIGEAKSDASNAIFAMQKVWNVSETIQTGAPGFDKYLMSYFTSPWVLRGNSEQIVFQRSASDYTSEFDDRINANLKAIDFKGRIKIDYCNVDETECFEFVR
jgi:hypothetical protein